MLNISELKGYMLKEHRKIDELHGEGYVLEHRKSGARVLLIDNDDNNKVFSIAFRTPPADDTGVAHILEHSVLCGSAKFPSKDPFVELAKGSLNTFLNAMTYPDKTVYPIASCNDQDYHNLMHVYLDAVFYPNIYKRDEILKQEGWHYELDSAEQIYMPYHLLPFWRSVMEHHKFLTVRATAAAAWPLCCLGPRQTAVAWTA